MSAEPVSSAQDLAGSDVLSAIEAPLARMREWAGAACRAVLLSGSHASGEAVWAECEGRRLCLSDLDVYVVIATRRERDAAEARARAARPELPAWLLARGFAAPLEVAFHTPSEIERLPPRPGTIELRRHGRVIAGDPAWRERVPAWRPADVPAEEVDLLLENRGPELLLAHPGAGGGVLDRLRSRHAVLKVALDLAGIAALGAGEYPDGAAARVAWARAAGADALPGWLARAAPRAALERLWDDALAWRSAANVRASEPERARADWHAAAAAWCATWWARSARGAAGTIEDPIERAVRFAARARLRRRAREAVWFRSRTGLAPALGSRLRYALRGTPRHRVNASAALLLLAASRHGTDALPARETAALARLGVGGPDAREWSVARDRVTRAWDQWMLEGMRTGGPR